MKRILVTGSSGYLGSRIAIRCRQTGHHVIATARNPTTGLEQALGLPVMAFDVQDPAMAKFRLPADALIHCATASDIVSRDFSAGVNLSVHGTRHVLELAIHNGIREIIFFSSVQVYGTELEGTISESSPPHCETPYALNHLLGEEVCRYYAHRHGLNIVLLRPANGYGVPDAPTVNRSALVPMCFVKSALNEERLVLQSSGKQRRNYISTDEIADACLHLLQNFPAGDTVINAGSYWCPSIREIADMVAAEYHHRTGRPLPRSILSLMPDPGNCFSLESSLGFLRPTVAGSREHMADVIRRLFDYFQRGHEGVSA
ncbi:MAG: NAD(P)-dependent oxidoreductase [Prosthecobacter sp.]|uniref:NAD-dependent epimerase/dehydratase family protein n=1 Tax=Prosthecobacter sp. TaxID=1965333 RepID=UPI003BAF2233